jgi:hypothetical protein
LVLLSLHFEHDGKKPFCGISLFFLESLKCELCGELPGLYEPLGGKEGESVAEWVKANWLKGLDF